MIDFFGHLAYASIMVGMFLLARRNAYGWVARLLGDAGWVAIGFALGMSSIILWGFVFIVLDVTGWLEWREKKILHPSNPEDYDLGRGVLYTKQIGYDNWVERGITPNFRVQVLGDFRFQSDDDLETELLREEL